MVGLEAGATLIQYAVSQLMEQAQREPESPFDLEDGVSHFRGLRIERRDIRVAGRRFVIAALKDAADLLDDPEFSKRFLDENRTPYGLELWPAASMLAEYLLNGEVGTGRDALELGCGLGLVSVSATLAGWRVTATDREEEPLTFARHNARLNNVEVHRFTVLDWGDPPADGRFDRVLAADVLYERADHEPILRCIASVLAPGGVAILVDPNREVANEFASAANSCGFSVDVKRAAPVQVDDREINGRIFELRRDADLGE